MAIKLNCDKQFPKVLFFLFIHAHMLYSIYLCTEYKEALAPFLPGR